MSENQAKKIFLGIGSNLGNRIGNIEKAKSILLENYINLCENDLEKAIKITPLNTDPNPYSWDLTIKQEAEKIWQKVMKK